MKSIAQRVQPNFKNDYTASVIKAVWYWLLQMSRARIRTQVTHKLSTDPLTEEPSYSNLISEKTVFSLMMLGQLDNQYRKEINLYPYFPTNTGLWIKCKVKMISFEKNTQLNCFVMQEQPIFSQDTESTYPCPFSPLPPKIK